MQSSLAKYTPSEARFLDNIIKHHPMQPQKAVDRFWESMEDYLYGIYESMKMLGFHPRYINSLMSRVEKEVTLKIKRIVDSYEILPPKTPNPPQPKTSPLGRKEPKL